MLTLIPAKCKSQVKIALGRQTIGRELPDILISKNKLNKIIFTTGEGRESKNSFFMSFPVSDAVWRESNCFERFRSGPVFIEKTSFVVFHSPQKRIAHKLNLNISNLSVKSDNQVKYLGLIFDSNLNWKPYLHDLSKKISRGIGVLSKIRLYVNGNILRTSIILFTYLPLPHLQFINLGQYL